MFRKIFASIFVGHATFVEVNHRFTKRDKEFSQQSADDLIMDSVETGDVLLFNRKWFYYHLPTAFMIKMNNIMYGKDSPDHAAVIIVDSFGTPFVYERTVFGGCKIRPYDQRILHSKSQLITLLPLNPRLELTAVQKNENRANIQSLLTEQSWNDSALVHFLASSFNYLKSNPAGPVCSSASFVLKTLSMVGVVPCDSATVNTATLMDFLENTVTLKSSVHTYDPKDIEGYYKAYTPVKQSTKTESKPKLTMLVKRNHYDIPVLPKIEELPKIVPASTKTIKLDLSHHVLVRTR